VSTPGLLSLTTNMKAAGLMVNAMDKANKLTRINLGMKVSTRKINVMDKAFTTMLTVADMKEPGRTMKNLETTVYSHGLIKINM